MGEEGGWEAWRVREWDSPLRPEGDPRPQQEGSEGNHRQQGKVLQGFREALRSE